MSSEVSFFDKIKNLSGFSWNLIKYIHENQDGILFVTDEVQRERMLVCRSCDKYDELQNSCKECGCYLPAKTKVILDSCPLGKWTEDKDAWEEKFKQITEELDNNSESL